MGLEGCLGTLDLVGKVPRVEWLVVKGLSRQGRPSTAEGEGLLARVLQHTSDHLDGIVFIAHIKDSRCFWRVS